VSQFLTDSFKLIFIQENLQQDFLLLQKSESSLVEKMDLKIEGFAGVHGVTSELDLQFMKKVC